MAFDPNKHLMNLKGKQYLQVMYRLVWFRDDVEFGSIETEHITLTETSAVFKATVCITDEHNNVLQSSTGYGSETKADFGDFIEKAETKAVGRALAMLGYGTQFAPELDEGDRIVDSPVTPVAPKAPLNKLPTLINNKPAPLYKFNEDDKQTLLDTIAGATADDDWGNLTKYVLANTDARHREAGICLLMEQAPTLEILRRINNYLAGVKARTTHTDASFARRQTHLNESHPVQAAIG